MSDSQGNINGDSNRPDLASIRKEAGESFWRCVRTGFGQLVQDAPAAWQDAHQGRYYRQEKRLVQEAAEGIQFGGMMAVLVLVTFRVSGSKWFNLWRKRNNINFSAYSADSGSTAPTSSTRTQFKSFSEMQVDKVNVAYREAGNWTSDIIVSIMCGLSSAVLLTDRQKIGQDFVRAPLLPGKSVIYNDFCPLMTSAHETVDPEAWEGLTENEQTLVNFHDFVRNCQIRTDYLQTKARTQESVVDGIIQTIADEIVPKPGLDGFPKPSL